MFDSGKKRGSVGEKVLPQLMEWSLLVALAVADYESHDEAFPRVDL